MWLLSTARAELHHFPSPQHVVHGYAILSHVWDGTEQAFQKTQELRVAGNPEDGYNPRDDSSPKVRDACIVAERDGYRWLWDDTCCIDKTSSSELSEAINSMFSYYACAEVCYAYLGDVPPGSPMVYSRYPGNQFKLQKSRWFKRGWTLQELLAPAHVVFLSSDWGVMGTKARDAQILEQITDIPASILTGKEEIWQISIATRMSWAAWRKTTRIEDEAYCLMGLFDVHMPPIYGEGQNAFRRLQEEIMRRSTDTSLFAWGHVMRQFPERKQFLPYDRWRADEMGLLAPSPSHFRASAGFVFPPMRRSGADGIVALPGSACSPVNSNASPFPSFEITPYGVRAHIPVIQAHGFSIAPLSTLSWRGEPLALLLVPQETGVDPNRPLYHCGVVRQRLKETDRNLSTCRLVNICHIIEQSPALKANFDNPPLQHVYITHIPPEPSWLIRRSVLSRGTTPFHVPEWILVALRDRGHTVCVLPSTLGSLWDGEKPATLLVTMYVAGRAFRLAIGLGLCTAHRHPSTGANVGRGEHWAIVLSSDRVDVVSEASHNCARDHIYIPKGSTKRQTYPCSRLPEEPEEVVLSFAPHMAEPAKIYVLTGFVWKLKGETKFTTEGDQ